jgi:hypothetical protein
MKQELLLRVQLLLASTSSLQQLLLQLVQLELAQVQVQNESWFSLSSWTTPLAFRQSQDWPHGASSVP